MKCEFLDITKDVVQIVSKEGGGVTMDHVSVNHKTEGRKNNGRSAVMMSMLETCKKSRNYFKESIDRVMSLHSSVQGNKYTTLKTLDNGLVENKRLGHEYFTNLDNLRARKRKYLSKIK